MPGEIGDNARGLCPGLRPLGGRTEREGGREGGHEAGTSPLARLLAPGGIAPITPKRGYKSITPKGVIKG